MPGTGGPPLDPNTCTLEHNIAGKPASVTATAMSSTVGEQQNMGKFKAPPQNSSSSSSAEGWGLSCTQQQQEGVAQLPQCLDRVASSHNNGLAVYWEVCFST